MNNIETKKITLLITTILLCIGFSEFFISAIDINNKIIGYSSLSVLFIFSIIGIYKTLKDILL